MWVLDKTSVPVLKIAQVHSVSNPVNKYSQTQMYQAPEQVVDVTVVAGDETMEFKQLPCCLGIANSGKVVIADNREAMLGEVESMRRISQDVLDHMDYHKDVVSACEEMMASLSPVAAQDKRIGEIEQRMGGMETALGNIQSMLSRALNKSTNNE